MLHIDTIFLSVTTVTQSQTSYKIHKGLLVNIKVNEGLPVNISSGMISHTWCSTKSVPLLKYFPIYMHACETQVVLFSAFHDIIL